MTGRVLICGDRDWTDTDSIRKALVALQILGYDTIIEGECRGADIMSRVIGEQLGFAIMKYPALWKFHHLGAGPIRNQQMLDEGKPNIVVYFHNNLALSKGTLNMVHKAVSAKITVINGMEL